MKINETADTWYAKSLEQIEKHFSTERGKGLNKAELTKAKRKYGANNVYETSQSITSKRLIPTDYTAIILLAVLLAASAFDVPLATGAIVTMLILNYVAAFFTYFKAQKVLDGMSEYSLPTAKVMRNGKLLLVDMRMLVPGDVIFLSAGDIVPADCRLVESDGLMINEASLTGMQASASKDAKFTHFSPSLPLEMQKNMAFASTIVTAGNGRAIVVATGENTAARMLDKIKPVVTHENLKVLQTLKNTAPYGRFPCLRSFLQ